MKRHVLAVAAALACASLAIAAAAPAAKPAAGPTTGAAQVFVPNPVQSLGDETLTDQKDADSAVPQAAYHTVTLTNLDGSGYLHGDFATVLSNTGSQAFSPTNSFFYTRHADQFEQVMAYYWITEAQKYIQSLGFRPGGPFAPVDDRPQPVRIDQYGQDNSFQTDKPTNEIRYGKGGVDDAEDAEVILHEYGHAIHSAQNFSFASEEAGAISEGFGDYWAVDVSDIVATQLGVAEREPLSCVADWDSTSYTSTVPHCLRRVDGTKTYPADLDGEVHDDGEIWSSALWTIRQKLGHAKADTIILQAQFNFPGTTMTALARSTVASAQTLYGKNAANAVTAAFHARGIL
jgi:zinc metalloprotease ZmpB